ncbi:MAG: hypothetical protein R2698_12750 [Microthrixaceae bacterium]
MPAARRPSSSRVLALGALVLLALSAPLAGCTSKSWETGDIDHPTTTRAPRYRTDARGIEDSLTAYLARSSRDLGQWGAPPEQARCAARRIVETLGPAGLLDHAYNPQKPRLDLGFDGPMVARLTSILTGCIDFSRSVVGLMSSYRKLPIETAQCFGKGVRSVGLDRAFATSLVTGVEPEAIQGPEPAAPRWAKIAEQCLGNTDLLPILTPGTLPPAVRPITPTTAPDPNTLPGIVPGGPLDPTTTTAP